LEQTRRGNLQRAPGVRMRFAPKGGYSNRALLWVA
jgi:hypothetical protein